MAGGRPRKLTPLEEIDVYQMYKENKPQVEIAYKYGVAITTVFRIVKRIEKQQESEVQKNDWTRKGNQDY